MHDRTRRLVCRVAFLALGVLPAAGVLAWSGWRGGAWHQRVCAAELSRTVGLQVSCNAVSYPRPGIVLYQGVELSDPETAAPLARMRFLETGRRQHGLGLGRFAAGVRRRATSRLLATRRSATARSERHGDDDAAFGRRGDAPLARRIANADRRAWTTFDAGHGGWAAHGDDQLSHRRNRHDRSGSSDSDSRTRWRLTDQVRSTRG